MTIVTKQKKIIYKIGFVIYFIAFLGCCMSPALTYWGILSISRKLFLFSLMLTIIATICMIISHKLISSYIKIQMLISYLIFFVIFICMAGRNLLSNYARESMYIIAEGVAISFGVIFWLIISIDIKKIVSITKIWVISHKFLLCNCAGIFILSISQLVNNLRWDSIHYYAYIERLRDFTFNPNDIIFLKASGHLSYGYMMIYSIGESILPGLGYGVRIETIFIYIITIVIFHQLLESIFSRKNTLWINFSILLFSVTPVILGPIHNIDVEILTLTFLICVLFLYYKKFYILLGIINTFFVFTKETCALFVGVLLVSYLIKRLVYSIKQQNIALLFSKTTVIESLSFYGPLLIFVIHFSFSTTWGASKVSESVDTFNTWGVNVTVIINKLEQLFIMNFAWLPTMIIIIMCLTKLVIKSEQSYSIRNRLSLEFVFTYLAFLFIQLFYITYTFPRYLMIQYFYLNFIFCWSLINISGNKYIKSFLCVGTIGLTFIQNFFSIDPISNLIFDTINIGTRHMVVNSPIVYMNNTSVLTGKDADFLIFSPYGDINRQWAYFDKAINKVLSTINYDENTLILYPDSFSPRSYNVYLGMWSNSFFDSEKQRLIQVVNPSNIVPEEDWYFYNAQILTKDYQINYLDYDRIYYLSFAYDKKTSNAIAEKYKKQEVSYKGWKIDAYQIK